MKESVKQSIVVQQASKPESIIRDPMLNFCDRQFAAALSQALASEWLSQADEEAYGKL